MARPPGYQARSVFNEAPPMSESPPDRLCANPKSPFYDEAILARGVGVVFKGADKTNVEEYCVSEGWVRLTVGKGLDRKGDPMTVKLQGEVAPYFRDADADAAADPVA